MAEEVKGRIGNEEVVLTNAASEATLEKLLEAVDQSAKKSKQEKDRVKKDLGDLAARLRDGTATVEDFTKATGQAAKRAASSVGRGFSNVGDAAFGLASEFATGSARISDFSSHITGLINQLPAGGILGAPLQLFASFVDNNIDTFRGLSNAGVDFGDSIFDARRAATRSGLALDTFANVVGNSSQTLAQLRGSATAGARAFTDISGNVQKFQPQFSRLGIPMEETAEFTSDFLAVQTRLGRAQQMSNSRLSDQTVGYINQLDELTRLTGMQRDQLSDQLQQESLDQRFQAIFSTLSGTAQTTITAALSQLGPQSAEAARNMIATGGVPITEFGKGMAILNPELQNLFRGLGRGTKDIEEVFAVYRETARIAQSRSDEEKRLAGTTAALGNMILGGIGEFVGLDRVGENFQEVSEEQQKAILSGSKGLANFESSIVKLRNTIIGTLIDSGAFKSLQTGFDSIIEYITEDGIPVIERSVKSFSRFFDSLVGKLNDNPDYTFVDLIKELGVAAIKEITPLFLKLGKELAIIGGKAIAIAVKEMFANPLVTAAIVGFFATKTLIGAAASGITNLFLSAAVLNAATGGVNGLFGTMKNMLGPGIGRLIAGIGKSLGIGALIALPGMALSSIGNSQVEAGNTDLGQNLNVAGGALQGAGIGATIGSIGGPAGMAIGAGIGAVAGGFYSMYQNRDSNMPGSTESNDIQQDLQSAHRAQAASTVTDTQLERLDKLVNFAPKVDDLTKSVGGFQTKFNSLNLSYREIDRATLSLEKMTEQLEEMNNQLDGDKSFLERLNPFGSSDTNSTGSTANNSLDNKIDQLNTTMDSILTVLMESNGMTKKQLRSMNSGNLMYGAPS